jgi:hypothetical protein
MSTTPQVILLMGHKYYYTCAASLPGSMMFETEASLITKKLNKNF